MTGLRIIMMIVCVLDNKWVIGKLFSSFGNHLTHVSFPVILYVSASIFRQYSNGGDPTYFTSKFRTSPYWSHKLPEMVTSVTGSKKNSQLNAINNFECSTLANYLLFTITWRWKYPYTFLGSGATDVLLKQTNGCSISDGNVL